jgi:AhpD family alkylhydroperoxidase
MARLSDESPAVMSGSGALHEAGTAEGALSVKTKELVALAIAITVRCDGCIAYHVHDARRWRPSSSSRPSRPEPGDGIPDQRRARRERSTRAQPQRWVGTRARRAPSARVGNDRRSATGRRLRQRASSVGVRAAGGARR